MSVLLSNIKNSQVQALRMLMEHKKSTRKSGKVVLEGFRAVMDAVADGMVPKECYVSSRAIASSKSKHLIQHLRANRIPFVTITDEISASLSDVDCEQGVFATFLRPNADASAVLESALQSSSSSSSSKSSNSGSCVVVLDGISDPGNMGTIIRTSYGCGVSAVMIIGGCDPFAPKVSYTLILHMLYVLHVHHENAVTTSPSGAEVIDGLRLAQSDDASSGYPLLV